MFENYKTKQLKVLPQVTSKNFPQLHASSGTSEAKAIEYFQRPVLSPLPLN